MKTFKIILLLLCGLLLITSSLVYGQITTVESKNLRLVKIELYRGIISVMPSKDNQIHLVHKTYDYDQYRDSIKSVVSEDKTKLNMNIIDDKLLISADPDRNLQNIELRLPTHLQLEIEVEHFGRVFTDNLLQTQKIQIFQGQISIKNAKNSVNASIIRDGDIGVTISTTKKIMVALSTYDGNINLSVPPTIQSSFLINSDQGIINNDVKLSLIKDKETSFYEIDGNSNTLTTSYWYKGILNNKAISHFLLKNVKGEISLTFIEK